LNSSDLQRVFRGIPGLFLLLRPEEDFVIMGASEGYLLATHTDPSIFGRRLFDVFPDNPDDPHATGVARLRASLHRVMATRQADTMPAHRYDIRLPAVDGGGFEERYWHPVNAPVLTGNGDVEYIVHRVEEATPKATRDAVQILESITEGFFTLDRHWRFDYVNQEAQRILGRSLHDLAGKVLWQAYPGLEATPFESAYRRSMVEREKASFTAFYAAHDRWYEVTSFPAPEGISVYFRDVSAQKKMEAERERLVVESERQRSIYETALDSTPDFVYVFDLEHRALYANEALLRTWGVADVRGKKWMDLGYEQWHADMHDREIDQVIATRAPIRGEIPFTGTNGTRVYDYIFAPVLDPQGEVVAVAGTTRDITERQSSEQAIREQAERLSESDREKDEFLATLSHELRNPLAPLRNSIALLRMADNSNEKSAPVHAMMERQVNHLVRLVDDLLEMSRISRGTLSLQRDRVELAAVVRNAVETSDPLIRAGGHELAVTLPPDPVWLRGDPVRLAQILANLLNNAAKYTDDGGHIALRASKDGEQAVISVRDNGIGIAPEALPRMFEMFSRGDRDSGRSQGGLGIGLALSRRLAQMHDGTLEARSDGPGTGSEFTVRLPLAKGAEEQQAADAATHPILTRTRVLVVDDNIDAAESLGMLLDFLGADVRLARDGPGALTAFEDYSPTVVLLDIGMPGMNGYEVASTIRSRHPSHPATLVALTGWGQDEDRRRAREAGFDHHLVKPAEIDALQHLLASLQPAG
jgi:PAS domain S-box-containing protein